jgi:beta-glucanase (GH16 family)
MSSRLYVLAVIGLVALASSASAQQKQPGQPNPPAPSPAPAPSPTPTPSNGAKLLFASEFDSEDELKTAAHRWRTGWPLGAGVTSAATPGEVEIYVDYQKGDKWGPNPFKISNSVLSITATPTPGLPKPFTYTSGCLSTAGIFSFQFGYAEMRGQAPKGSGFWPTFWMMPWKGDWSKVVWPPEIDIYQASSRINNQNYPAVLSGTSKKVIEAGEFITAKSDLSAAMHTYGFEWTETTMTWYLDGAVVMTKPSPAGTAMRMYLMLSLAVGDNGTWIGKPDGSTQSWLIDYVRVYDRKPS